MQLQQQRVADEVAVDKRDADELLTVMEGLGRRRAPNGPYSGGEVLTNRLVIMGVVVVLVVHCFLYLQVGILLNQLKVMEGHMGARL
jgi:hypothetical protein